MNRRYGYAAEITVGQVNLAVETIEADYRTRSNEEATI